jgi:hypothetical protein
MGGMTSPVIASGLAVGDWLGLNVARKEEPAIRHPPHPDAQTRGLPVVPQARGPSRPISAFTELDNLRAAAGGKRGSHNRARFGNLP